MKHAAKHTHPRYGETPGALSDGHCTKAAHRARHRIENGKKIAKQKTRQ
jgi:hypothetical protein